MKLIVRESLGEFAWGNGQNLNLEENIEAFCNICKSCHVISSTF